MKSWSAVEKNPGSRWEELRRNQWAGYAFALICTGLAFLIRLALDPYLKGVQPFGTFYVAVAVVAWWLGLRASLLSLVAGYLLGDWFFLSPRYGLAIVDVGGVMHLIVYAFVTGSLVTLIHWMRRAEWEAKANAEALRRSESILRSFYESSPMPMGIVEVIDEDHITYVYNNPAARRALGLDNTDGKDAGVLGAPPEAIRLWARHYQLSEQQGQAVHFEYARNHGQSPMWFSTTVAPLGRGPSGRSRFSYVAEDVTERKRAEVELVRQKKLLETASEAGRIVLWTWDVRAGALEWSEAGEPILGYPIGSLERKFQTWVDFIHPDDRDRMLQKLNEHFKSGADFDTEYRIRRQDGSYLWWHVLAHCQRDKNGDPCQMSGACNDITEIVKAKEALARSRVELENLVEERTSRLQETVNELEHFSYSIAHDMRAPLRAMSGFARFLWEDCADRLNAGEVDYLRRIINSSERMDRLIRDALSYSKAMREEIKVEAVDVGALISEVIESYPSFQLAQARIRMEGSFPPVRGNQAALTQCFSNLLDNAVKFVAPGNIPRVRVWAQALGDRARFWVEDNGIGIPPEHQQRIFGMFQRVSNAYEGTGIGLAIVRKVVERMGGEVGVESNPKGGSRFWVELPQAEVRRHELAPVEQCEQSGG